MALKVFLGKKYETTHEGIFFDDFVELLKVQYDKSSDDVILIGNLSANGADIDAVFIKNDSLTVIDFKNYGGEIEFFENGPWYSNGEVEVKGGVQKNPYLQLKKNKFDLLEACKILNKRFVLNDRDVNWGHISAIALFHQPIEFDSDTIPQKIKTWFHVVDASHIVRRLENITSRTFNFSKEELMKFVEAFNLQDDVRYETPQEMIEVHTSEDDIDDSNEKELVLVGDGFTTVDSVNVPMNQRYKNYFNECGWNIVHNFTTDDKKGEIFSIDELNIAETTRAFVEKKYKGNLYKHQLEGLREFTNNKNVCITTSTASGKSTVFFTSGIELLSKKPDSKIIAIYPVKALGNEQTERWGEALKLAELNNLSVGRIDGSVAKKDRKKILDKSSVVIMTPDVIHAWLLNNLTENNSFKQNFLSKLELVIIDEAHIYKGVFGSNTAYLLRRINHIVNHVSGQIPLYLAASATIETPEEFLSNLTGVSFEIIDAKFDTAPKNQLEVLMVEPNDMSELLRKLVELIAFSSKQEDARFINFVDSRLLVSNITKHLRQDNKEFKKLEEIGVFPYRSGLEDVHRREIEKNLSNGNLKGVVSTSALELGIDIDGLNLGILFGVPYTATSYFQRIGRVGRHGKGLVIIVNDGTVKSQTVFSQADQIENLPFIKNTLYLENEQLQNIHATCLADNEYGELRSLDNNIEAFETDIDFSSKFIALCDDILSNTQSKDYSRFRNNFDSPHFEFPLRNLSVNYKVKFEENDKGFINKDQMIREAYPGAIFEYLNETYRVSNVKDNTKTIYLTNERQHSYSKPAIIPKNIQPTYKEDCFAKAFDNLFVTKSNMNIVETVTGFYDISAKDKVLITYGSSDSKKKKVFRDRNVVNSLNSSGVCLYHPAFNNTSNDVLGKLAELLYNIFIVESTYDKQDVGWGTGKSKFVGNTDKLTKGDSFIVIYDQNRGSLKLTDYLYKDDVLKSVIEKTKIAVEFDEIQGIENKEELLDVLNNLYLNIDQSKKENIDLLGGNHEKVLRAGKIACDIKTGDEYLVMGYITPLKEKMAYNTAKVINGTPDFANPIELNMKLIASENDGDYAAYDLEEERLLD